MAFLLAERAILFALPGKGKVQLPSALFQTPTLEEPEQAVLWRIDALRARIQAATGGFGQPRKWLGNLRSSLQARAVQGSNSIEGYHISLDDAIAAVEGEELVDATREAALAVVGYQSAMSFVLRMADDPYFAYSNQLLKSLHFMMLQHRPDKNPGRWRHGAVHVEEAASGAVVYQAPEVELVPSLMDAFIDSLAEGGDLSPLVRAAMAHLNLAMIHPFSDGNGRMARCVQSLVLARKGTVAPVFSSIEEYLGRNTPAYYAVLAEVGNGAWHPERDARPWLRFCLVAHFRQATTLVRRIDEAERLWERLDSTRRGLGLPERMLAALSDAAMGYRVRNATYRARTGLSLKLAGRDLKELADRGLLVPKGERRGRSYVGSDELRRVGAEIKGTRDPLPDPFTDADPLV